eukprot:TRINITY_DN6458_c0_g1_i1.p1 TRINITY_DN6458_c0_g1~~TRINITY_DN6458_c0_g1_i1.p1  ORF type:complete len:151 (-),score=38.46 TRINITY_DN6458_c0_g1_i1:281-733(-)
MIKKNIDNGNRSRLWIEQYILGQNLLLYSPRLGCETIAVLMRCVVTYVGIRWYEMGVLAFGMGMAVYGITLVVCYVAYFVWIINSHSNDTLNKANVTSIWQLLPQPALGVDADTFQLVVSYSIQSIEKLVLTEGEKVILMMRASLMNQGV